MTRLHGIDVSHHQNPLTLPWAKFAATSSFCIARAAYGVIKDRAATEHVKRARGAGLVIGLYLFHRPNISVSDHLAAFGEVAEACGLHDGDIIPTLDIEDDTPKAPVKPEWSERCQELVEELAIRWNGCMVYTTQRDWARLGKPAWLLEHPLWVAHWTAAKEPATPDRMPWTIWQYRVGPYQAGGTGGYHKPDVLDHNWAERLPLIRTVPDTVPAPPPGGVYDEAAGVCRTEE